MHNGSLKEDQLREAWTIGRHHGSGIWFSAPGSKHYESRCFKNRPHSFANVSITGKACALHCEHCNAGLLQTMLPAETPEKLCDTVDRLIEKGCRGILVSGGADSQGIVPLDGFTRAIEYARKLGLKVLVHTGLLHRDTAMKLKDCGVNQVLIDIIGSGKTIRDVYHLDRQPDDYLLSMLTCREIGLDFAPHIVIGLHFGQILGEYEALRMIQEAQPETLVMVILRPTAETSMCGVSPPDLASVKEVLLAARVWNPDTFLNLGCVRPAGVYKRQVEKLAIDCGFNGIAFPSDEAIDYTCNRGLNFIFTEQCCSMAGISYA